MNNTRPTFLCPHCSSAMSDISNTEQSYTVLSCTNEHCKSRPVYRRVDIQVEQRQDDQRAEAQAGIATAFYVLNEKTNAITRWMHSQHPEWLTGSAHPLDIALHQLQRYDVGLLQRLKRRFR